MEVVEGGLGDESQVIENTTPLSAGGEPAQNHRRVLQRKSISANFSRQLLRSREKPH